MKKKLYIAAIACACLVGFSSCESWLDEENRTTKTDEVFPTLQSDVESMVTSLYRTGAPSELSGPMLYIGWYTYRLFQQRV